MFEQKFLFQYFLTEADLGKNRAVTSAPRVAELNLYVQVDSYTGSLSTEFLSQFEVCCTKVLLRKNW